jgi:hypothetical protein
MCWSACLCDLLTILTVTLAMIGDHLSISDDWSIDERVHVRKLLESIDDGTGDSRRDQRGFKPWRTNKGAESDAGLPMTAEKSGGNVKREARQATQQVELQQLKGETDQVLRQKVIATLWCNVASHKQS